MSRFLEDFNLVLRSDPGATINSLRHSPYLSRRGFPLVLLVSFSCMTPLAAAAIRPMWHLESVQMSGQIACQVVHRVSPGDAINITFPVKRDQPLSIRYGNRLLSDRYT